MTNLEEKKAMEFSSVRNNEVPLQQPMPGGHHFCSDIENTSLQLTPDDSNSFSIEANFDTRTKTLNVILNNCNAVLVGQSNSGQIDCNQCLLDNKHNPEHKDSWHEDALPDSSPKVEEERCKQQKVKVQHQVTPFHDAQDSKLAMSGEGVVDVEPVIPLIKTQGYLHGSQCERIMEQLEHLQDNGQFEKHDRLVATCLKDSSCKGNTDMELALTIERGVAFSYQKEFKKSKRLFISVINTDTVSQLINPNILLARAYYRLVQDSRYRKNMKLSVLFHCLEKSEFLLQNHQSPVDWSEVYYNYGSLWLAYMSTIPDDERHAHARNDARGKARLYFEKTIECCKKDHRLRVQIKQQTYGHLRVAALLLDCTSTVARIRKKVIPPQDIEDTKKHLDILERQLGSNIPRGTRVQILKTRSDQYYRQGLYQLAKETAEDALRIASRLGFNTELDSLQERIDFLHQLCDDAACKGRIFLLDDSDVETSSNNASCETSGSETETKYTKTRLGRKKQLRRQKLS